MRIVITRLGNNEIKEIDYEDFPGNNILTQKTKNNTRTISYNKIPKKISLYNNNNNNTYKERNNNSLQQKIEYTQFPPINKSINNINTTFNNQDKKASFFLQKIGEYSLATQNFRTPKKSNQHLKLTKNNGYNLKLINKEENPVLATNFNNNENTFKKIKINSKKLNIPLVMLDKYSKQPENKNKNNNNLFNNNEDSKINNTENSLTFDKNKMYTLREILLPKNQKKIDDSFLDKKINSNGGESIINYLQSDRDISPSLIEKINRANNEQIYKLDKICQKYFNDEKLKNSLDNEIKEKIKKEYELDSIYYKNNLNNMSVSLKNYNNVYKRLRLKKENYENFRNMYLSHKK